MGHVGSRIGERAALEQPEGELDGGADPEREGQGADPDLVEEILLHELGQQGRPPFAQHPPEAPFGERAQRPRAVDVGLADEQFLIEVEPSVVFLP